MTDISLDASFYALNDDVLSMKCRYYVLSLLCLQFICAQIRRAVVRHEYAAVISVFPVLKHLRTVRPVLDVTLEVSQSVIAVVVIALLFVVDVNGIVNSSLFLTAVCRVARRPRAIVLSRLYPTSIRRYVLLLYSY